MGMTSFISITGHSSQIQCSTGTQSIADVFFATLLATVLLPISVGVLTSVYWFACVPTCPALGCTKGMRMTSFCKIKYNPFKAQKNDAAKTKTATTDPTNSVVPPPTQWKTNRDGWIVTNVYFIFIFFPSIVRLSFETFQCQDICGELFLARDDKEMCWLSNSRQMFYVLAVATPALLFYLLLLPCLTLLYLYRHRQVLRTDHKLILRFGLLFSGCRRWRLSFCFFIFSCLALNDLPDFCCSSRSHSWVLAR